MFSFRRKRNKRYDGGFVALWWRVRMSSLLVRDPRSGHSKRISSSHRYALTDTVLLTC